MRRLLLAAAVAAAVVATPTAAQAYTCGGVVDYDCYGYHCSLDCFYTYCGIWLDPMRDPHRAVCTL